MKTNVTFCN